MFNSSSDIAILQLPAAKHAAVPINLEASTAYDDEN